MSYHSNNDDTDFDGESVSSSGSFSIESVESNEQHFQDSERVNLIIKSFESITHQINPKYRNCIDSVISNSYTPNTTVKYLSESGYKIMYSTKDNCVLHGNGKLIEVSKSDIDIEPNYLDSDVITQIYTRIYKNIDKNMFDIIKFFTIFADTFNIDYKLLYDNIPYNHRTKIESLLKNKYYKLFGKTESALW